MAEVTSAGKRQQGKNTQPHARHLQSRRSLGVARQEPDYACAPKREAAEGSHCVEHRAAQVAARISQGAGQDRRASRHSHWTPGKRAARAKVVRRGFREPRTARYPFHFASARRSLQDGGIAETGSARSRAGRGSAFVAQTVALPDAMDDAWVFASPASKGELPY